MYPICNDQCKIGALVLVVGFWQQSPLTHVYECVLQGVAVCCSVLQCVVMCCRVVQCVAVCSSVLQRVAVCCSVL